MYNVHSILVSLFICRSHILSRRLKPKWRNSTQASSQDCSCRKLWREFRSFPPKKSNFHLCEKAGAEFSFDYLLLVILAGIIAFMGLLENSSVVLVASMLVSPIMGEVNHATLVTQWPLPIRTNPCWNIWRRHWRLVLGMEGDTSRGICSSSNHGVLFCFFIRSILFFSVFSSGSPLALPSRPLPPNTVSSSLKK